WYRHLHAAPQRRGHDRGRCSVHRDPVRHCGELWIGGRFGPAAIREASRLLRPYNVEQGIEIFEYVSAVDAGDLSVVPGNVEASYRVIESGLGPILDAGVIPLALGGDHSITLGELRAVFKRHGPVGLIDFDSHT